MMGFFSGLFLIVRRSLREHLLSSIITMTSVGLGCALVMAVFNLSVQSERAFSGGSPGFDAILGPKGSPLQIVMNAVYHLDQSPGNIPWTLYEATARDPRVELAIPYVLGDNYQGFRVVGTVPEIFTKFQFRAEETYRFADGRGFDPSRRQAVLGSTVARQTGLSVGSIFQPSHGLQEGGHIHETDFEIVGVLESTNTPADRIIWIPATASFRMEGHYLRGGGELFNPAELQGDYVVGANYSGHRLVGIDPLYLEHAEIGVDLKRLSLDDGRWYKPDRFEVVLGAETAAATGLSTGDRFEPDVGITARAGSVDKLASHVVVGILAPLGHAIDREIFAPPPAVRTAPGYLEVDGGDPLPGQAFDGESGADGSPTIPDEYKEVAAVLIKFRNRSLGLKFKKTVEEKGSARATLVFPVAETMLRFLDKFGVITKMLVVIAYLVVLVAGGSILASLYNTMNERRREFAILRALGARRPVVFGVIVLEAVVLAGLGCLIGFVFYVALMIGVAQFVYDRSGVVLDVWAWHPVLMLAPLGMLILGAVAGLLPAFRAYSVDVSDGLQN